MPKKNPVRKTSPKNKKRPTTRRRAAKSPCAGKSRAKCQHPCKWRAGPKRQYCAAPAGAGPAMAAHAANVRMFHMLQ